jgi:hypothetical protein
MTNYEVTDVTPNVTGVGRAVWDYAYSSFYVAATVPVSLEGYGAALLSGSFAIPTASPGRETLYETVTDLLLATRRWSADTYWATLEGIWAYPLSNTFTALASFRWVCWQTSYKSPTNELDPGLYAVTDKADVTVNGYVPFVGLMVTYRGLNVGAVGIPTTIGDVLHNEVFGAGPFVLEAKGTFTGGYFFEMFADYSLPVPGTLGPGFDTDVSLYSKFSLLEIQASPTVRWTGAAVGEEERDFSLHRNLFVIGAKATMNFNLAGLLPF